MQTTIQMKKIIIIPLLSTIALFLFYHSCVDPYTPDLSGVNYQRQLVIEGRITTKQEPYRVKLSRTVPLDSVYYFDPEENAVVRIHEIGGIATQLIEVKPGIYETNDETFIGKIGKTYSLEIITTDGKQYESDDVTIVPVPEIDKIYFDQTENTSFINDIKVTIPQLNIYVDSNDPTNKCQYFKWEYRDGWQHFIEADVDMDDSKRYCWRESKSTNIIIETTEQLTESRVLKKIINRITQKSTRIRGDYAILLHQYSIDKKTYKYWDELKKVNESSGQLHDIMPYSISGNITCCTNNQKALGYFEASDVKVKFFKIPKWDHNIKAQYSFAACDYDTVPKSPFIDSPFKDHSVIRYKSDHMGTCFVLGVLQGELTDYWILSVNEPCTDCQLTGQSEKPDFWQ